MPLDGLLLLMHGAIYVNGVDDPEGDWISAAREALGIDCFISVSFDLHGQVTNKIVRNIDAFAAFKTAPHIDVKETYHRAARMLCDMLTSQHRMNVIWCPIPVLVSGEMSSTLIEPCRSIYSKLEKYNEIDGVIDCNLLVGYVWTDTARATAAAVVTCSIKNSGIDVCIEIAKLYWQSRHQLCFDMDSGDIHSAVERLSDEFSIIADSGDNPTAGGVGDRADILDEIIKHKVENVLFAGIASQSAYTELKGGNDFVLGNDFGGGGPQLKLHADSVYFKNECAIVRTHNISIIVTKKRRPFHYLSDFLELNINLADYHILIVKSGYLAPEIKSLSAPSYMVLSDGAVNQNLKALTNNHRNRPIYPFQKFNEFNPQASDGLNYFS